MDRQEFVWLNDDLIPLSQARVSVEDRGFLYGDGFFETVRAEKGKVFFLREHLDRLAASAAAFRLEVPRGIDWQDRLGRLLAANGIGQGLARVKILLSRGVVPDLGLPFASSPTLVMWAKPYVPPSAEEYAAGWPVAVFPQGRTTFLGRHKSLNYLFYLAARQYALDLGAKEALILEADGQVSEGAATSLVFFHNGRFFTPQSASALPGVTLTVLSRALKKHGPGLGRTPTDLPRLREAQGLWLANSLLGLLPVAFLDGEPVARSEQGPFLQEILWAEARASD
jgi:branched-chain amino acid aminotransferase/para-aminobenzoate synthetase component 1